MDDSDRPTAPVPEGEESPRLGPPRRPPDAGVPRHGRRTRPVLPFEARARSDGCDDAGSLDERGREEVRQRAVPSARTDLAPGGLVGDLGNPIADAQGQLPTRSGTCSGDGSAAPVPAAHLARRRRMMALRGWTTELPLRLSS